MGSRIGSDKLIGHAKKVLQYLGVDPRQTNQNGAVVEIVIRHVVNLRSGGQQLGTIIEIHANDNRARFGRRIRGYTGQEFPVDLKGGKPVGCALLHPGQRQADVPYRVEVDFASGHRISANLRKSSSWCYQQEREPCLTQFGALDKPCLSQYGDYAEHGESRSALRSIAQSGARLLVSGHSSGLSRPPKNSLWEL